VPNATRAPKSTPPPQPAPEPPRRQSSSSLPQPVASAISSSLGVDTSPVRVHADANATTAASMFGARALTIGSHVFLGAGERPTDVALMAHEVAHVVQQQGAPRVQLWSNRAPDPYEREAHQAAAAVVARRPFTVRERTKPRIQRFGLSDLLDWFADKANNIPGFRMFTVIIGVNPINGAKVERTGANILRAAVEFMPGGHLIVEALDKYGVFEKAGAWLEQQVATLGMTGSMFIDALKQFIDSLGWSDILHPGRVWDRAKALFTAPIRRLIDFFVGLAVGILKLIKDAILKPLAKLAEGTPAWDLLLAVLGRNPITGEPVPQNADAVIGGFMKLIGQQEIYNNIKRANALSRAWAWFKGALAGLLAFVRQVPTMFLDALRSLEIADIILLPRALLKVGRAFVGIAGRFLSWALQQVLSLLQIIFEVVAPSAVPYIKKAAGAFNQILRNPVGFVRTLVRAGIVGFQNFGKNFLSHLRRSLIEWITGTLAGAGVYIPQAFELREIVKFVLSVLGLTWANIRGKLLRLVPEPVLRAIETGLDIVVTLVREGPAAAWEKIRESLSNLKDMVMEQIMSFVRDNIITQAITRLVSSLNPAGAFIQAIIAIYNTVMFFIERLRQIAQVAMSFIDSIAAIAAGNIGTAAARVEQTMAGLLTLVISFLARLVGLGRVSDAVKNIVNRIRQPIDRALDRVVEWIVGLARRAGRFILQAGAPQDPRERLRLAGQAAVAAARRLAGRPVTSAALQPILSAIKVRYSLTDLAAYEERGSWKARAVINPIEIVTLGVYSSVREAQGAAYAPIVGKLTQAIQMFTEWARLGTAPVAQQMLRQLEAAREMAHALSEEQQRGVPTSALEPRKQALIAVLRGVRNLDPGYALISIAEMEATIRGAKKRMPEFQVTFTMRNPTQRPEYERQLREHQDGVNAMLCSQWLANRTAFYARRAASVARGASSPTGRSPAGTALQATFQQRSGNPPNTAAPHNPDQVAAGFDDPTGMPVAAEVNSSIGPQWRTRSALVARAVNQIPAAEHVITQMNLRLTV
jgi:Domain of unknown function (DUF4157)/Novel toxin 15